MMIKKTKLAVNMTTMSKMRTKKGVAEIAVLDVLHIIGSKKQMSRLQKHPEVGSIALATFWLC